MIKYKDSEDIFIGIDESNHGRYPEIFVAVASPYSGDTIVDQDMIKIKNPQKLFAAFSKREFRYAVVTKSDYERFGPINLISHVSSALIEGFNLGEYHSISDISIFIDGELRKEQRTLLKKLVSTRLLISRSSIGITPVPKKRNSKKKTNRKKTNRLIVLADSTANYLFRKKSLEELTSGKISRRRIKFPE